MAAGAAARGDGTIPPLRRHRTILSAAALAAGLAATGFSAVRSGDWWLPSALLGLAGTGWLARCAGRRAPATLWCGVAGLGAAYALALAGNLDPVDPWAAAYGVLLLLVAELAHTAAGAPDLDIADPATRGQYWRSLGVALLACFGAGEMLLAVGGSGGRGGAEATALGMASAAAALGLLLVAARRATAA